MRLSKVGTVVLVVAVTVPMLAFIGVRLVRAIQFDIGVTDRLKRAADANTVDLARAEVSAALSYVDAHGLKSGYTSILYRTPDEDVGYWFKNLDAALGELESVKADATQLERSNVLMKLRETLIDQGKEGPSVTLPDGISVFPYNMEFAGGFLAGLGFLALGLWVMVGPEER